MSLKKKIEQKLNEALKAKDKSTYPTLRLVVSAIKDAEIASRTKNQKEMSDSDLTGILKKMIKQKKILIVGAGGFIGGHLVKRLFNYLQTL